MTQAISQTQSQISSDDDDDAALIRRHMDMPNGAGSARDQLGLITDDDELPVTSWPVPQLPSLFAATFGRSVAERFISLNGGRNV